MVSRNTQNRCSQVLLHVIHIFTIPQEVHTGELELEHWYILQGHNNFFVYITEYLKLEKDTFNMKK